MTLPLPETIQHELEKVRRINDSQSIAIVLPAKAEEHHFAVALAVALFFKDQKKSVRVFSESGIPAQCGFLNTALLFEEISGHTECVLVIDHEKNPVQEIRYEKTKNGKEVRIIITPKSKPICEDDIRYEHSDTIPESVIAIGAKHIAAIGSVWKEHPEIFFEKPLISITAEGEATLAEKAASFLKEFSSSIKPEVATPLLYALFYETDALQKKNIPESALTLSANLIAAGAEHAKILEHFAKPADSLECLQLWGRACVRSKIDHALEVFWSFVTAEDFAKTGTTPSNLPYVFAKMAGTFPTPHTSVFLWQHPVTKKIYPKIFPKNKKLAAVLEKIKEYETFLAAEKHINELLREGI